MIKKKILYKILSAALTTMIMTSMFDFTLVKAESKSFIEISDTFIFVYTIKIPIYNLIIIFLHPYVKYELKLLTTHDILR